jgi:hypothetical protein
VSDHRPVRARLLLPARFSAGPRGGATRDCNWPRIVSHYSATAPTFVL